MNKTVSTVCPGILVFRSEKSYSSRLGKESYLNVNDCEYKFGKRDFLHYLCNRKPLEPL